MRLRRIAGRWRRRRRGGFAFAVALLAAAASSTEVAAREAPGAAAKPARIVSMNVCADQLVMLLADPSRIASLSFLASDPNDSAMFREAAHFAVNHGLAEEILPLDPDLVFAGAYSTRPTVFLLRRFGFPVVELPVADSLDDVRANIRFVARAVGEVARGEAMVADFDRALPATRGFAAGAAPLAVLYGPNGYTSGIGTLANAAVEAAGFRTLGRQLALAGIGALPLETLLVAAPDVLILARQRDGAALASEVLWHPALKRRFTGRTHIRIADHLWGCGTPFIAEAIARLASAREDLAGRAAPRHSR